MPSATFGQVIIRLWSRPITRAEQLRFSTDSFTFTADTIGVVSDILLHPFSPAVLSEPLASSPTRRSLHLHAREIRIIKLQMQGVEGPNYHDRASHSICMSVICVAVRDGESEIANIGTMSGVPDTAFYILQSCKRHSVRSKILMDETLVQVERCH